eukprot:COSAG02_NODE_11809_length_1650_cov_1.090264_1_plen_110_part_00
MGQVGATGTPEEKEAWLVRMHSCLNGNEPCGNGTSEDPGIVFASLDLQPSWKLYVDTFGYEFAQWDIHKSGEDRLVCTSRTICFVHSALRSRCAAHLARLLSTSPLSCC